MPEPVKPDVPKPSPAPPEDEEARIGRIVKTAFKEGYKEAKKELADEEEERRKKNPPPPEPKPPQRKGFLGIGGE